MKFGYADPPYPGLSHRHYRHHPDFGGEVDHGQLVRQLLENYDGFVLHTGTPTLHLVLDCVRESGLVAADYRVLSWVKPFSSWKPGALLQYAWEPVIIKPLRRPEISIRDWLDENMAMSKGIKGAKPRNVCWWLFEALGATADDEMDDLFTRSGAVTEAWQSWVDQERYEPGHLFHEASTESDLSSD